MLLPQGINLAELAFANFQAEQELEQQARIETARKLYEGEVSESLIASLEESALASSDYLLAVFQTFNIAKRVVDDFRDRMQITGFESSDEDSGKWMWHWWIQNKMQTVQHLLHTAMLRDGEAFIIVDYDQSESFDPDSEPKNGRPRFWVQERFTSAQVEGTNEGMSIVYEQNNPMRQPLYATKRWVETVYPNGVEPVTRQRMTVYVNKSKEAPVKIERYFADSEDSEVTWSEYTEDEQEFPIWWTDTGTETGRSLPFPVIHFHTPNMQSRILGVEGAQYGMNQTMVSLIATAAYQGFPVTTLSGAYATTDGEPPSENGENWLEINPRNILGSPDPAVKFDRLPPGDLGQLITLMDKWPLWVAMYTNTPGLAGIVFANQQVSGETLKQFEAGQTAEVERLQDSIGDSWEQAMRTAWALELAFGDNKLSTPLREVTARWSPAEKRIRAEVNNEMRMKQQLGIPQQQLWSELGYAPDKIAEMISGNLGDLGQTAPLNEETESADSSAEGQTTN